MCNTLTRVMDRSLGGGVPLEDQAMKVTQKEFDSLKNRYNEVRLLCDSYSKEILELKQKVAKLEADLEVDACLRRYEFGGA